MFKKITLVGCLVILGLTLSVSLTFAQSYNPQVRALLSEAETVLENLKSDAEPGKCEKTEWSAFAKSFLSYDNLVQDNRDLFGRNDCLREDIWELENMLHEINVVGVTEAKKCSENLVELKAIYQKIVTHIVGLRLYGENSDLEKAESQNCPNCKKAQSVGVENVSTIYANDLYTAENCPITKQESQAFQKEWNKFKNQINLYKNIKKRLQENDFSLKFNADDYAEAQQNSQNWWGDTWRKVYSYNGKYLSSRHLYDGEDSLFSLTRIQNLGTAITDALGQILLPPTIAELTQEYVLQSDVYESLTYNRQQKQVASDLVQWRTKLALKYQMSRDVENDLENDLIHLNNALKTILQEKYLSTYTEQLNSVVSRHCQNLYGACK